MRIVLLLAMLLSGSLMAPPAPTPPALYPGRDVDTGLGRISDLAFSSDGRLLAASGARGFGIWDAQTGNPIRREGAGSKNEIPIDLGKIMARKTPDITLLANDVLYIPDNRGKRLVVSAIEKLIMFGSTACGKARAPRLRHFIRGATG